MSFYCNPTPAWRNLFQIGISPPFQEKGIEMDIGIGFSFSLTKLFGPQQGEGRFGQELGQDESSHGVVW